jgi:hypothetical protein
VEDAAIKRVKQRVVARSPVVAGRRSNPGKNEIATPFALYTMRCRVGRPMTTQKS